MRKLLAIALLSASCASATSQQDTISDMEIDVPWESPTAENSSASEPSLHTNHFYLTWQGQRIGSARETFHRSQQGVRIIRKEDIRITRAGLPIDLITEIEIHADKNLRAERVELSAQAGAISSKGTALRADNGDWIISLDQEKVRRVSGSAVPLELIPYIAAHKQSNNLTRPVLLAGYGFATATLQLEHDGQQGTATLQTPWGDIDTNLHMAGNGELLRSKTGSTGSVRVEPDKVSEEFVAQELPDNSSIPVRGKGELLAIRGSDRRPPPALDGQEISIGKEGWKVRFTNQSSSVSRKIRALTKEVDSLLNESHDAPGASAQDAMALGRGDCTAHATLFAGLAAEQGIETQIVTGYRIDQNKLVRHRWVAVRQGSNWVQVDPTFGQAPIQKAQYLALAVHGDSTADLSLVDEAVFRGFENAEARWIPDRMARPPSGGSKPRSR